MDALLLMGAKELKVTFRKRCNCKGLAEISSDAELACETAWPSRRRDKVEPSESGASRPGGRATGSGPSPVRGARSGAGRNLRRAFLGRSRQLSRSPIEALSGGPRCPTDGR